MEENHNSKSERIIMKHVAFKGVQLGSILGFTLGHLSYLRNKYKIFRSFINKFLFGKFAMEAKRVHFIEHVAGKSARFSLFFGIVTPLLGYFKMKDTESPYKNEDRAWRLQYNMTQINCDQWSSVGAVLGSAAFLFMPYPVNIYRRIWYGASVGLASGVFFHLATSDYRPLGLVGTESEVKEQQKYRDIDIEA